DWGSLFHYVVPGIALSLLTVAIGMGAGVLLSRREPEISTQTGILGMMPGGSSTMPVMARATGADYPLVALSQYTRLPTAVPPSPCSPSRSAWARACCCPDASRRFPRRRAFWA